MYLTKINIKIPTGISLIPVPLKNPRKEANADLKALSVFLESLINSKTNAPISGPRITPGIPKKKIPTRSPAVEPIDPALVPPDFFVSKGGRMVSTITTATVTIRVMIRMGIERVVYDIKYSQSNPAQARGGPGRAGKNVPINPRIKRTIPAIRRMVSMDYFSS